MKSWLLSTTRVKLKVATESDRCLGLVFGFVVRIVPVLIPLLSGVVGAWCLEALVSEGNRVVVG